MTKLKCAKILQFLIGIILITIGVFSFNYYNSFEEIAFFVIVLIFISFLTSYLEFVSSFYKEKEKLFFSILSFFIGLLFLCKFNYEINYISSFISIWLISRGVLKFFIIVNDYINNNVKLFYIINGISHIILGLIICVNFEIKNIVSSIYSYGFLIIGIITIIAEVFYIKNL